MPTVAYLGPEHTNTHLAAVKRFGKGSRYVHAPTVDDVFHLVERRRVDYGVVPIENSLEGTVTHTLDRFIDFVDTPVNIHGETEQPIRHCLLMPRGTAMSDLRIVYSHPQALAQCSRWLERALPQVISRRETSSTAEAVESILRKGESVVFKPRERAAIGRMELATKYHLKAVSIPEERENRTRFLVIGHDKPAKGRKNKTSILFALKDRPGALHDSLVPFKREKINLTKIESRPSKRKAWEYLFFIDIEGHVSDAKVTRALAALKKSTSLLRILGSYPMTT